MGVFILFTVLENIVEGFQEYLQSLFKLFENLLVDPESLDVRITTTRYVYYIRSILYIVDAHLYIRALGVIAQYIDSEDTDDLVGRNLAFIFSY